MLTMFRCLPISFIRVISVIKFRRSSRLAFAGDKKCIESYWQIETEMFSFIPSFRFPLARGEWGREYLTLVHVTVVVLIVPPSQVLLILLWVSETFPLVASALSWTSAYLQPTPNHPAAREKKSSGRQGKVLFAVLLSFLAIFCWLIWQSTKACKLGRNRRV